MKKLFYKKIIFVFENDWRRFWPFGKMTDEKQQTKSKARFLNTQKKNRLFPEKQGNKRF